MEEATTQGRIDRLEVENFKSYRGHQQIGPFKNFTAVIGPNGSGKSNLMDAISFVLGVKTTQLRGSLKELLYSNSEGATALDKPRRGYVKLVYKAKDGEETHFSRVITPSGASADAGYQSHYKINDRNVNWELYNNQLKSLAILVKARNFLVFQGDIESVAAMSPKDITSLFENISGSGAFRKEYEQLEQKKNETDEKTSFISSKKKSIMAERKQKKEQKEEAEKHMQLQQELEELQREYYLWRIFHIDTDLGKAQDEMETYQASLNEMGRALMAIEQQVEAKKKEQATHHKERMLKEKKVNKRKAEMDKKNPEAVKTREEISRLSKRVKLAGKELQEGRKKQEDQRARMQKLAADLESITAAQEALEADLRAEQAQGGKLLLSGELVAEYNRIKAEAGAKTCDLQQQNDKLQSAQQTEEDALRNLEDTIKSLTTRLQEQEQEQGKAAQHRERVAAGVKDAQKELAEKKAQRGSLTDDKRRIGAQRDYLAKKLEEVEAQLKEAKADRKESERDRKMAEGLEAMKRLFPGVHGRVTELAKVTQRKFNLALAVLLGRDLDSVIVDSEKTAKECIQFLREQRMPPMTFYPLASVKAKPVNERLRQLGGTARLALDLLDYDPALERAFLAVCGNTLVCDTVDEAKRLAFSADRHKVVSLDGTLINKAGLITGGMSGGMEARASRWDDQLLAGLKQDRTKYAAELAELPDERETARAEEKLSGDIEGLQKKIQYMELDVRVTGEKLQRYATEITTMRDEMKKQEPGLAKLQAAIAKRQERIDANKAKINGIKDKIFAAFSAKVGVANIREYEESHLRAAEQAAERRLQLATQASRLRHQLEYEARTDLAKALAQKQQDLQRDQATLERLQQEEEAGRAAAEAQEAELQALRAEVAAKRAAADEVEAEIKTLKAEAHQNQTAGSQVKRALSSREAQIEQLRAKRADLLAAASMEQVALAEKGGGAEAMDVDGGEPDGGRAGGAAAGPELDFSGLTRAQQATLSAKERDKLDGQYVTRVEELTAKLARIAPNMKAVEQYDAVKAREREQAEALEAAQREARAVGEAFTAVRQQRFDAFMAAFDHISAAIDSIFKDLTRSGVHPTGGTAYLSLESAEDPFLAGIKFTAMPPTKRFRDMEQLSGGEKTVAALALLFAIHSFQPSPFFVLDEIDAALDATNVARVAKYIREKTRSKAAPFQSIVISLKENLYHNADALVGVSRDSDLGCSRTYTFDLNRFGG